MTTLTSRETRDWVLFADWCESMDTATLHRASLPTTAETVADFLVAFPAPIEAQGRRVRAIRRAHEHAQAPLDLPTTLPARLWREGAQWASVPRALAQVPKYQHALRRPAAAIRGRRDAWLIVLVGILGLSRNEARNLLESEVDLFPRITIKCQPIVKADPATECPACAVTRWLRIAGLASIGFWGTVKDTVRPDGFNDVEHDCASALDGTWRDAATLLPAVDRHGGVSAIPMSDRAVSTNVAYRQSLGPIAWRPGETAHSPSTGRFANATMNELANAYDDVDEKAAALLLRLKEIVGEGDEMLDHPKSYEL